MPADPATQPAPPVRGGGAAQGGNTPTDDWFDGAMQFYSSLEYAQLKNTLRVPHQERTKAALALAANGRDDPRLTRVLVALVDVDGPSKEYVGPLISYGDFNWPFAADEETAFRSVMRRLDPADGARFARGVIGSPHADIPLVKSMFFSRFGKIFREDNVHVDKQTMVRIWDQIDALPESNVRDNQKWFTFALQGATGTGGYYNDKKKTVALDLGNASSFNVRHEIGHAVMDDRRGVVEHWLNHEIMFVEKGLDTWIRELGGYPQAYMDMHGSNQPFDWKAQDNVRSMINNFMGRGTHSPKSSLKSPDDNAGPEEKAQWAALPRAVKNACAQSVGYSWTNWRNFQAVGSDRYFLCHYYGKPYRFGSLAADTINQSGDSYTAMSDKEFFANCYAVYFNDSATAAGQAGSRGALPSPVRQFFETNIADRPPYPTVTVGNSSPTGGGSGPAGMNPAPRRISMTGRSGR